MDDVKRTSRRELIDENRTLILDERIAAKRLGWTIRQVRAAKVARGLARTRGRPVHQARRDAAAALIEAGRSNREIADALGVTCSRVRQIRKAL